MRSSCPHVLRYNASLPSKFMPAPGYSAYVAPEKYAEIGRILGFGGRTEQDRRERLFARVDELLAEVEEPRTLADCGVKRQEFDEALPDLARAAFVDPSIRTNPRIPMIREVVELLQVGYPRRGMTRRSARSPTARCSSASSHAWRSSIAARRRCASFTPRASWAGVRADPLCLIALHTEAERDAMFVRHADEAVCLAPTGAVVGGARDGSHTLTTKRSSVRLRFPRRRRMGRLGARGRAARVRGAL